MRTAPPFDVRAWMVWGASAFLIALLARNPFVLLELGIVALTVRFACVPPERLVGIGWMLRIAPLMLAIGVVFNVLTVRSGDRVLATLPESWPVIGGELTWNAFAYGVVSALALFVLLLVGTTLGALMRWIDLTRSLPQRIAPLAVAGSVAWVFLPELSRSFTDIRESMVLRGIPLRGPRSFLPLVLPLLAQGLERAMTTAEVLETRGFGGRPIPDGGRRAGGTADLALIVGLVGMAAGGYDLVSGGRIAWPFLMAGGTAALVAGLLRRPVADAPRTRYRMARWRWADTAICAGSMVVAGVFLWRWIAQPGGLGFDPYPRLEWPTVDLVMMLVLPLLALPAAIVAYGPGDDR
ncbi:MAG: energy-coupling factor transporter transmembrane component T [Thermomicrobiales bacterium]